ncbi:MAG: hypothetical protein QNJ00_17720, partial [Woeseiaceae bacterium]|nr:hypothetical protein [Woeseiaceae bacterium]
MAVPAGAPRLGRLEFTAAREWLVVALLIPLFLLSPPLFILERYSLTAINKPMILGLTVGLAVILVSRFAISRLAAQLSFVSILQATALLTFPFLHQAFGYGFDGGYFSVAFQILACCALFLVFATAGRVSFLATVWVNLHLVIGALSLVVFVGGIVVNLEPLDTFLDRPYYDFGLAYTNIFYQVGGIKLIRAAGFYDEPGTFAFYMTLSLLLARAFRMPRWKEGLIILFGITSISMAFFVVVALWVLLSINRSALKYIVIAMIALPVALQQVDEDVREFAYSVTIDR